MESTTSTPLLTTPSITVYDTALGFGALCLAVPGFLLYFLIWLSISIKYSELQNAFYLYVISAGVADMGFQLINLLYCIPCILLQKDILNYTDFGSYAIGFVQAFLWQCQAMYSLFIAVNRCAYVATKSYRVFELSCGAHHKTVFVVCLMWLSACGVACFNEFTTCHWRFAFDEYAWKSICTNEKIGRYTFYFEISMYVALPIMACIVYSITWIMIVLKRRKATVEDRDLAQQMSQHEIRLLVQFSIITIFFLVYVFFYWLAPLAYPHKATSGAVVLLVGIFNASFNPLVYVIWDKKVRMATKKVFLCCGKKTHLENGGGGTTINLNESRFR